MTYVLYRARVFEQLGLEEGRARLAPLTSHGRAPLIGERAPCVAPVEDLVEVPKARLDEVLALIARREDDLGPKPGRYGDGWISEYFEYLDWLEEGEAKLSPFELGLAWSEDGFIKEVEASVEKLLGRRKRKPVTS